MYLGWFIPLAIASLPQWQGWEGEEKRGQATGFTEPLGIATVNIRCQRQAALVPLDCPVAPLHTRSGEMRGRKLQGFPTSVARQWLSDVRPGLNLGENESVWDVGRLLGPGRNRVLSIS